MSKNWIAAFVILLIVSGLYGIELSKVPDSGNQYMQTLDDLDINEAGAAWAPFYHVRATLIDGNHARVSVPQELSNQDHHELALTGAAIFFGSGSERDGDAVSITQFYLLPTLGLAQACETLPEIAMRWTILVQLKEPWLLRYDEMIDAEVSVKGTFRIDDSKPYESVFYLDNATAELVS
ncbi:hypothetical protein K8I31_13500 [bacterium]|nr:hypothetical protein [bacterium]